MTEINEADFTLKSGKWSGDEDAVILECMRVGDESVVIQQRLLENDKRGLVRKLDTIKSHIKVLQIRHNIVQNVDEAEDLLIALRSKLYYPSLKDQFTDKEVDYFEQYWITLMQQFRGDVLPSEEMHIKQLLTVEILMMRNMSERKGHIQEAERIQKKLDIEYKEVIVDDSLIDTLTQQLNYVRSSASSYTSEYDKLSNQHKALTKDLKANRDARIKRIEDSKGSWAQMLRALDDEEYRSRIGDEIEVMKIAKDNVKEQLSEWHTYIDGNLDQPFLTADTVKNE